MFLFRLLVKLDLLSHDIILTEFEYLHWENFQFNHTAELDSTEDICSSVAGSRLLYHTGSAYTYCSVNPANFQNKQQFM